jgi:hypothetical protein
MNTIVFQHDIESRSGCRTEAVRSGSRVPGLQQTRGATVAIAHTRAASSEIAQAG